MLTKIVRIGCSLIVSFSCVLTPPILAATQTKAAPLFEQQSRFHPALGKHAAVAAQELTAATVGRTILRRGGNAVDAAVAVGFALMVTLPRAGALGGGGFMMIWLAKQHRMLSIDYRETAPQALTPSLFLLKNGHPNNQKLTNSWLSSGVPGTVAGLCLAQRRYGHLSLAADLAPAIHLAQHGIIVRHYLANALRFSSKLIKENPLTYKTFSNKRRQLLQQGDLMRRPQLAHTLQLIAKHGPKAFYQGAIATAIVKSMQAHGGLMTLADLKSYKALLRKPIAGHYKGATIYAPPPPSSGGVSLIEMLHIWNALPKSIGPIANNSAQQYHLLSEVMNRAYYDRNRYLGDPKFITMPLKKLLSLPYAKQLAKKINITSHVPSRLIDKQRAVGDEGRDTTHYSVVDKDGNMVANTYSLNFSFGNGHIVPGTGILLNNSIADFTITTQYPNAFGLMQGDANLLAPNRRPLSSMTPVIMLNRHDEAWLATGSPGGSRIITTVFQFLLKVLMYHQTIAEATETPRIHSQLWPDILYYEQGISPDTLHLLAKMGHQLQQSPAMGSLQTVTHNPKGYGAFSDTRRIGAGVAVY